MAEYAQEVEEGRRRDEVYASQLGARQELLLDD